jgi:hypothetical protein
MSHRATADLTVEKSHVRRRESEHSVEAQAQRQIHPLVKLQRQVGNATIARTLAQREGEVPEEQVMAKHDPSIQREGEVPEEQVMAKHDPNIQREEAPEVGLEGGEISRELSGQIESKRGGGSALDAGTQSSMESAFGERFDDVRIHTDDDSDRLNRSVSAKAFTTGSDIFFSRNASPGDNQLLAHELTHVVQQRGSSASSGGQMTVGAADDVHEHSADAAASAVASGGGVQRMAAVQTISREAAAEDDEMI